MLDSLTQIYGIAFFGTASCLAVLELLAPARPLRQPVTQRWCTNLGLYVLSMGLQRLLLPVSVLALVDGTQEMGGMDTGLLPLLGLPQWGAIIAGILLLDLWKYVEHRLYHAVPLLWRLHAVHHSDTDADFTTTERHHPLETALAVVTMTAVILVLGIPLVAAAIYFILAAVISLFSHANLRLPAVVDAVAPWAVITPRVHTIHHSADRPETDSNFGIVSTMWDRLFRTYRMTTPSEDAARVIGLEYFRDARSARLDRVLLIPFLSFTADEDVQSAAATAMRSDAPETPS